MALTVVLNGVESALADLSSPTGLPEVLHALRLKADRIAVELNGEIVRRKNWDQSMVSDGDKLEVVHFVGGGKHSRSGRGIA